MAKYSERQQDHLINHRFRYYLSDEDPTYCINAIIDMATGDDTYLEDKRQELLDRRKEKLGEGVTQITCSLEGCHLAITEEIEPRSRVVTGACRAASYCLKLKFAESGEQAKNGDTTLYKDIMTTCVGQASKYSAGNFCPRPGCDLSAGFSIDGIGGTAGECQAETVGQMELAFEPPLNTTLSENQPESFSFS